MISPPLVYLGLNMDSPDIALPNMLEALIFTLMAVTVQTVDFVSGEKRSISEIQELTV
jgi:hypothetical protein